MCEAVPFASGWDVLLANQLLGKRLSCQFHLPSAQWSGWLIGCLFGVCWMRHGLDGGVGGPV